MNISEEFFSTDPLLDDLKAMVKQHASSHPRSQQVALGPSQVGHPCARNVISGMVSTERNSGGVINPQGDPLPSYIGVAAHKAMEAAAQLDNKRMWLEHERKCQEIEDPETRMFTLDTFHPRWLTEREVKVTEGLSGTCDLYDTWTDTVVDYKFPGTTKMTEYRRNGPSALYRVQAHLYGRGYRNEGFNVKRVGIWFLPRGGLLSSSKLWTEDYSEDLVQEQLSRWWSLIVLADELKLEQHPERLALIPVTPYECSWCPYFTVNPERTQGNPFACPGGLPDPPGGYKLGSP